MAVISKGIKLSYSLSTTTPSYIALTELQKIPDLGGETESVETTTLEDAAHTYTDGIKNYGDNLEFQFLYSATQFATLAGLSGVIGWKVELPDGAEGALDSACTFNGSCSVKLDGVGVNSALTYVLAIKPSSEMIWA